MLARAHALLVALSLIALPVAAQEIDADINLGDQFTGRLDDAADIDVLRFEALAGFELTAAVVGAKDPEDKAAPKLVPRLEVLDLTSGDVLASDAPGKTKAGVKKLLLPSTGLYLIRIASGDDQTSGPYKVKTKGKLGKAAKSVSDAAQVGAGGTFMSVFEVLAGAEVSWKIGPGKKSPALPAAPTLSGPTGNVDLAAFLKSNAAKGKHTVKKLPLATAGSYTLTVDNGGEAGEIAVKRKLKTPKVKGAKLVEPEAPTGVSSVRTLSGRVDGPDGEALPGVEITAADTLMAVTDDSGSFLVLDPPMGEIEVVVDGTTTSAMGSFPELHVVVDVAAAGETVMMALALPDLDDPETAADMVAVDGAGATTEPIAATGAAADIQLSGPTGTLITLHGAPASGAVEVLVTPVEPSKVPMALEPSSGAVDASSYVTIQPAAAEFDTGAGGSATGLSVVLPNDRGLPVGTAVDIWSFDHDVGDWVNRSEQTGQQGVVVMVGQSTQIEASGVIVAGGWHAPVVPVDANCATTFIGRVVDEFGQPLADATVATSLGQFTMTAADGTFSLVSVPAYDASALPACELPLDTLMLDVLTSVSDGAVSLSIAVDDKLLVQGGTTDVGDLPLTIPNTGSLAGQLVDMGTPLADTLAISGEAAFDVTSNSNGSFFKTGLAPGDYTASYAFEGDAQATEVDFSIAANTTTTINVQRTAGVGAGSVDVLVLFRDESENLPYAPLEGAQVRLVGTDDASAAGILGTSGADGRVTFDDVDGPFTASAQVELTVGTAVGRVVSTVVDITPTDGVIVVPIDVEPDPAAQPADATLSGTVSNLPAGPGESVAIQVSSLDGAFSNFTIANPLDGTYSVAIPSGLDLMVLAFQQADGATTAFELREGVGRAGVGATLTEDFDAEGAGVVVFDRQVDVTYTNTLGLDAGATSLVPILWFDAGGAEDGDTSIGTLFFDEAGGDPPTSIMLPDVDDPALGGRRMSLFFEQASASGLDDGVGCDVFLDDDPIAIEFVLPSLPEVTGPSQGAVLSVDAAEQLTVEWTPGLAGTTWGWSSVVVESDGDTGIEGIDFTVQLLLVRAGSTSAQLPVTTAPMFSAGLPYLICVEEQSLTGLAVDFDALLSSVDLLGAAIALEDASDGFCESYTVSEFETMALP